MIHDIDILQAVQQKLKERFPYPVYLQEVKEGFAPPAFFCSYSECWICIRQGRVPS